MIPEEGFFQPRVKPKHRCPMTKELQYVRKHVIPKLLKNPMALPFKYPVDAITEGIYPDYFMVISHPMDLYTIKARLDHGWYWNLNHCVSDINLVWRNARMYNPPDHVLHEWALNLKNLTYSMLKKVKHHAWTNEDRLNTHNLRQCENLLETVLKDRTLSEPFKIIPAAPGSQNSSGRPQNLVDLDTIERNLNSGLYPNAEAFASDFRKMISRIYRYSNEDDPIVEQAKDLSHKFEYEYAKRILTEDDDITDNEQIFKEDMDEDVLKTMLKKAKTIEDQLAKLIQDEKAETMEVGEGDEALKFSKEELEARKIIAKDLVVKIAALDSEKLKKVVSIVRNDELSQKQSSPTPPTSQENLPNFHEEIREQPESNDDIQEEGNKDDIDPDDEEYLTLDFGTMNYDTIMHLQEYVSSLQ
eukprot:TRINITY_DN12900_c0_g1_i1.p1 TRINITY_DN12900_c0_g1~~TRINITY_DN12900_c0_g1_i1.p1  ORF type:complete len:415 (-),score=99.92 TRINITY_DN12900_c0_g1_i1:73-1317(-)